MAIIRKEIEQLLILKVYDVKICRHPSIICDNLVPNMTKSFNYFFKNPKISIWRHSFSKFAMCEVFWPQHNFVKNSELGRNHI